MIFFCQFRGNIFADIKNSSYYKSGLIARAPFISRVTPYDCRRSDLDGTNVLFPARHRLKKASVTKAHIITCVTASDNIDCSFILESITIVTRGNLVYLLVYCGCFYRLTFLENKAHLFKDTCR